MACASHAYFAESFHDYSTQVPAADNIHPVTSRDVRSRLTLTSAPALSLKFNIGQLCNIVG
jgi:hypothetical protein